MNIFYENSYFHHLIKFWLFSSGHITNILQELPYHLEEKERKCFNDLLNV